MLLFISRGVRVSIRLRASCSVFCTGGGRVTSEYTVFGVAVLLVIQVSHACTYQYHRINVVVFGPTAAQAAAHSQKKSALFFSFRLPVIDNERYACWLQVLLHGTAALLAHWPHKWSAGLPRQKVELVWETDQVEFQRKRVRLACGR